MESLRVLIALSVQFGLQLHQVDVTTAFLNGELEEEVYMQQPKDFIREGEEHLVCKLNMVSSNLLAVGTQLSTNNLRKWVLFSQLAIPVYTLYVYINAGGDISFIGVYVDDIILVCRSLEK